jgi:hypothetical protein
MRALMPPHPPELERILDGEAQEATCSSKTWIFTTRTRT